MTLSDIVTNVRYLINDVSVEIFDIFTYENDNIFTLTSPNALSLVDVLINNVSIGSSGHSFADNNVSIAESLLDSGDTVKIIYNTYLNYSDTELKSFVRQALMYLSIYHYNTWTIEDEEIFTDPTDEEANLIAVITAIIIEPDNKAYSLPDLKITPTNTGVSLSDRIKQVISAFKRNGGGVFFVG